VTWIPALELMQDINKNTDVLKPFFEICKNFDFIFASPAVTKFISEVSLVTNSLTRAVPYKYSA